MGETEDYCERGASWLPKAPKGDNSRLLLGMTAVKFNVQK